MLRSLVVYDKPIYVGFAILEESKRKMYSFHYEFMKNKFQDNIKLCYTDTDSLIYSIFTDDFYEDIKPYLSNFFDTSNYDSNNIYEFEKLNKKKIGYFKDENAGKIMLEFVGLKAKMYSFKVQDSNLEYKKAKGIQSSSIKHLYMSDYKNCVYNNAKYFVSGRQFRSKLHNIYTLHVNKLGLDNKDNKRCVLNDNVHTLALGNKQLE